MDFRRFISHLLAVLVIAGLVAAPLVTPVAAQRLSAGAITDMSAMDMSTMDMSADMPCCPDKQKTNDCSDCPLVAMCMLKTAQAEPSLAGGIPVRLHSRALLFVSDDPVADGLDRPPPEHPPRTLV